MKTRSKDEGGSCTFMRLGMAFSAFLCLSAGGGRAFGQCDFTEIYASDAEANDEFGWAVAISGDFAIVAAPFHDGEGSAYILKHNGTGSWSQAAILTASDGASGDNFGYSVSISGDVAIIGSPFDDDDGTSSGSAYIFVKPTSGWANATETVKITASDAASNDNFGQAVAIDGDTALVGLPFRPAPGGAGAGAAYLFTNSSTDWSGTTTELELIPSDNDECDRFGFSVAVDTPYAVVGAPFEGIGDNPLGGTVFVFDENHPDGAWKQRAQNRSNSGQPFGAIGWSVALDNHFAITGGFLDKSLVFTDSSFVGSAEIYERDHPTPDNWGRVSDQDAGFSARNIDWYGYSVGLSGDNAIVGVPRDDDACCPPGMPDCGQDDCDSGSAYVLNRDQVDQFGNVWGRVAKLVASDQAAADNFGWAVAIDRGIAIISSPGDDDEGSDAGSVYLFAVNCPADIAPTPCGNGVVNVTDLLAVISGWGPCPESLVIGGCPADITGGPMGMPDGIVNRADLDAVIDSWGTCTGNGIGTGELVPEYIQICIDECQDDVDCLEYCIGGEP